MSDEPTVKEVIDGMNAVNEMMKLFKTSRDKLGQILPPFIEAVEGDQLKWFEGIEKVSDLELDDAHGCLIVALSAISQINAKIKGTSAEEVLKEIFKPRES
jgi:hypothetical protein